MIRTVGKLFSYLSVILVLALLLGFGTLAARGQLAGDRLETIAAVLRGDDMAAQDQATTEDPFAALSERELSETLMVGLKNLETNRQRWDEQKMQEQTLAESRIETARRLLAQLIQERTASQAEADRLETLLQEYKDQVLNTSLQEVVATLSAMRPKDAVQAVSLWTDAQIARTIVPMGATTRAKIVKELTRLLGPKRSGTVLQEMERQLINPEARPSMVPSLNPSTVAAAGNRGIENQ